MKKTVAPILLVIAGIALLYQFAWNEDVWSRSLEKVLDIIDIVENKYYQEADPAKLTYGTIRGMLLTLDPHSYFLDPDNYSRLQEDQVGKYFGLGIQIQKQEDRLVVISPIEGTPAYRLGIQAGDIITHINGESTKPLSSFEAMQRLRGEKGSKVRVMLVREGMDKPFELTVVREEIPLYSVPYAFLMDKDTGFIFIRNFSTTTPKEIQDKLMLLASQGMKSLILDLRLNGGGPLFPSVEVADEFLPRGTLVVSMRGRNKAFNREFRAVRDDQYESLPIVALINQGSASASEIVAGAIMDNDRGLIVGEDSFGKGLVQTVFPLSAKEAMALTTAKYYTPSGRSIQRDYANMEDWLMAKEKNAEEREVRYTAKGRKVLGQGGITPDYVVRVSNKALTIELLMKGAYFGYALKFSEHGTPLAKSYVLPGEAAREGGLAFGRNFEAGPDVIEDFKAHLRAGKIGFDEAAFAEALPEIKREVERELGIRILGPDGGQRLYRRSDPVVLKALAVMPEAARLLAGNDRP